MSLLDKLKFKNSNTKFADGRKLVEASLTGKFTRDNILKNINSLAAQFEDEHVQLGAAIHYKGVNKWAPALFRKSTQHMMIWDPSDSPETAEAYRNDTIDTVHFFVLEDKEKVHKDKYRKPKKT